MSTDALLLPVGGDCFAILTTQLREVVACPEVTPMPTENASVLGLFNLHGELIPLFDTSTLLGLGPLQSITHVVVVETRVGNGALGTSAVPLAVQLDELVGTSENPHTLGIYSTNDMVATLIDADSLLRSVRVGTLSA